MIVRLLATAVVLTPALFAHAGEPLQPDDLWTAWRFDLGVIVPLLLTAVLYARGVGRARGIPRWRIVCFWTGLATLFLALASPLHPLGEVLFSAHMVQHEVLMLVSAPLLALSKPLVPLLWGLPFEWRRTCGQWSKQRPVQIAWLSITTPAVAALIHAAAIWSWHAPVLFESTLSSEWMHAFQHISFFGSGLLFWWSLFHARGSASYGPGVLYLFATAVHTSVLGALLTFSRTLWYTSYGASSPLWGMTPLEDQQTGGLIMWVPGGLVYLAAALVMFGLWMRESDAIGVRGRYAE